VDALETLRDCTLPGIPGLEEVEEDFPFAPPVGSGQGVDCVNVLVNSVGLDGHSCSLVVARYDE
jgi:3-oxoacyl-(acyl-carrier-protein) synthase